MAVFSIVMPCMPNKFAGGSRVINVIYMLISLLRKIFTYLDDLVAVHSVKPRAFCMRIAKQLTAHRH